MTSATSRKPNFLNRPSAAVLYGFRLKEWRGFPGIAAVDRLRRHEARRRAMAHVADHLSVSALEQQYRSCPDVTASRHLQAIWLLAKGHHIAEVSATVSYARRWVERLLARYNAQGPQVLGDLRR